MKMRVLDLQATILNFLAGGVATLGMVGPAALGSQKIDAGDGTTKALSALTLSPMAMYADDGAAPAAADTSKASETLTDPDSFFKGWKGSLAFGLNGSDGNTERLSVRFQADAKRDTTKMLTTFGAVYSYAADDGNKSESRAELLLRNDWKFGADNRWRFFVLGKGEYDEFKDWTWRVSGVVGIGYELIKTETTLFVPRVGIGFSREFGGMSNEVKPELDLGWDFEHKFNENVKFFNTFDYYPSLKEVSDFRIETKAGLDVLLSKENNLSLKLGIEDKYDSTPEGKKKNDISYFALVAWNF